MKKKLYLGLLCAASLVTLAACSGNDKSDEDKSEERSEEVSSEESSEKASASSSSEESSEKSSELAKADDDSGLEEKRINVSLEDATKQFLASHPDTIIKKVKLEKHEGKYVYEIKGYEGDKMYVDFIDADTADIVKQEEGERKEEKNKVDNDFVLETMVKPEHAIKNVLESAKEGTKVIGWKLDNEGEKILYKLHLRHHDGSESEEYIDAHTGDIVQE